MTIWQIISFGVANLLGSSIGNIYSGYSTDHNGAAFGGGFSMLFTLAVMAWVSTK
ncbi:hypothetical protein LB523_11925 [Mesorhizobium sp. ESP-6-4]|uniref:hypothetical protein n=1 Tax=Mesorhizobium sp. ESP-6-4 TaxID=2876624 RepID=UPI001CCB61CB|nr:hypothetical protein [Mesorhizobium sp. ESP-6-4]MBZ9659753.1 hypothetical protein [Mesorhizobium sp. ESP-6-4]